MAYNADPPNFGGSGISATLSYPLDTNVIGSVTSPLPSESLVAWLAEQADEDLFISSLTVAEIRRGVLAKPAGKKRRDLERWSVGSPAPNVRKRYSSAGFSRSMKRPPSSGRG
jgi:predicted phosphoribosyltransferase